MFFMEKRRLLLLVILAFAFSFSFISAKTIPINNQSSCELAQGEWQYISPENAESRFECVCNEFVNGKQVKIWDGTSCSDVTNKFRCENSGGVWISEQCNCNNGEWISGVGCQFVEHDTNLTTIFIIGLIVLIVILIILIIYLRMRRK